MPDTNSTAQMEDGESDDVTTDAMRRDRLAELIGRLLARVMVRRRADDSEASNLNDVYFDGP